MKMTVLLCCIAVVSFSLAAGADPFKYKIDEYIINYSPDPNVLPTINVTNATSGKTIWHTTLKTFNFVTAVKVNTSVLQNGGNFVFPTQDPTASCDVLTINNSGKIGDLTVGFDAMLCGTVTLHIEFQVVYVAPDSQLSFGVTMAENELYNQLRLSYGCHEFEQFYGFGVQYSVLNMKGRRVPVFVSEQGVGRGLEPFTSILDSISPGAGGSWNTTYSFVPQYVTNYSRSLWLSTMAYTVFDLTVNDTVTIEINSSSLQGRIVTGERMLDVLYSYTAATGRLKPLPSWIGRGAVLGLQGGTAAVQKYIDKIATVWGNESDIVGVWLQDWTGQRVFSGPNDLPRTGLWWNWEVDSQHYPNWVDFIQQLLKKGIRTLTYINPLFSNVTQRGTPFNHNYLEEGLKNDYFIKRSDGSVWEGYGSSCMADLTQDKARQWLTNMIATNMLETGVCGWMCDFGESVPLDFVSPDPQLSGPETHYRYPGLWAKLNAQVTAKKPKPVDPTVKVCEPEDIVYFMRSGNYLSPSLTSAYWLGDQMVLWDKYDGLGTVVVGMLTGGLSGVTSTHSDIGGYTAIEQDPFQYIRTKELFLRWCELAAFTTIYRSHLGTLPNKNWQVYSDDDTIKHFMRMAVVFQSWGFYRQALMEEAYDSGWPVARHMMLVFPSEKVFELSEELKYQFMLGTDLLVAPVLQAFGNTGLVPFVRVFLPVNIDWVHVWSNKVYKGNDEFITVPSQVGQPCVLFPAGSRVGQQFVQNLKNRNIL